MNCPRCMRELVIKDGVNVCAKCGLSVGGPAISPVIEKVVEPEGSMTTLKEEPVQESIEKTVEAPVEIPVIKPVEETASVEVDETEAAENVED